MSETDAIKTVAFSVTDVSPESLPKTQRDQIFYSDISIVKSLFVRKGKRSYYKKATTSWRKLRADVVKSLGATAIRSRCIGAHDHVVGKGIGAVAVFTAAMSYCRSLKESKTTCLLNGKNSDEQCEEIAEETSSKDLEIAKVVLCDPIANIKWHMRPFFFLAALLCIVCRLNPLFLGWILFVPVYKTKGLRAEYIPFGMLEVFWSAHKEFEELKLMIKAYKGELPFDLELYIDKKIDFCNSEKTIKWVERVGGKSFVSTPRRIQIPVKKLILLTGFVAWVIFSFGWLTAKLTWSFGKLIMFVGWLFWFARLLKKLMRR